MIKEDVIYNIEYRESFKKQKELYEQLYQVAYVTKSTQAELRILSISMHKITDTIDDLYALYKSSGHNRDIVLGYIFDGDYQDIYDFGNEHRPIKVSNLLVSLQEVEELANQILECPENWNGIEYPKGIKGEKYPFKLETPI